MNQTVEQYRVLLTIVSAVVVCYGGCPSTTAAAQEEGLTRVSRPASAEQLRCEQVVLRAARLDEWPQSESLRSAPQVNRSLLLEPDLVTAEHRSCGVVVLDGVECFVVCGHALSSQTFAELEQRVAAGATCIISRRLYRENSKSTTPSPRWHVVENFTDESVVRALRPFVGPPEVARFRFANQTVEFRRGTLPNSVSVKTHTPEP